MSSAKVCQLLLNYLTIRSLINIKNNKADKTDPCGTLLLTCTTVRKTDTQLSLTKHINYNWPLAARNMPTGLTLLRIFFFFLPFKLKTIFLKKILRKIIPNNKQFQTVAVAYLSGK